MEDDKLSAPTVRCPVKSHNSWVLEYQYDFWREYYLHRPSATLLMYTPLLFSHISSSILSSTKPPHPRTTPIHLFHPIIHAPLPNLLVYAPLRTKNTYTTIDSRELGTLSALLYTSLRSSFHLINKCNVWLSISGFWGLGAWGIQNSEIYLSFIT